MKYITTLITALALLIPTTSYANGDLVIPPQPGDYNLATQARYAVSMTVDGRPLTDLSTSTATLNTPHTFFYSLAAGPNWAPGLTQADIDADFADSIESNVTYVELWKGTIFGPDATFVQAWDTNGQTTGSFTTTLPESGNYFFLVNTPNTIDRHPLPLCTAEVTQNCNKYPTLLAGTMDQERKAFMPVPPDGNAFHTSARFVAQYTLAIAAVRFTVAFPLVRQTSNIVFLPGITGSRLYEKVQGKEKKDWELNLLTSQADAKALYLTSTGKSVRPIYSKADATIAHVDIPLIGFDIYQSFLSQLAALKATRQINDFAVFPYDWRLSPTDIAENGTQYDTGVQDVEKTISKLASSSPTGKVTLVGHSNGGLVAKALMIRLQRAGKAKLVDKVILIDVPQIGTPETLVSMLHGDFGTLTGLGGVFLSQSNARGLVENMPAAFDLLPTPSYFGKVADPVIDMTNAPALRLASAATSQYIATQKDLFAFLSANANRAKPAANDIASPNTVSPKALSVSASHHIDLDSWTAPFAVRLIQIAGWGLETTKTINYTETRNFQCALPLSCGNKTVMHHGLNTVVDGDGTVILPSETAVSKAETYYLDLFRSNRDHQESRAHADLTETKAFQDLFSLLLGDSLPSSLPAYVSASIPKLDVAQSGMRIHLSGPAIIHAVDSVGRNTGPVANANGEIVAISESIPNSSFKQIGDDAYVTLTGTEPVKISIQAVASGTLNVEISKTGTSTPPAPVSYGDIQVSGAAAATLSIIPLSTTTPPIAIDPDGKGSTTVLIYPTLGYQEALKYVDTIIKTIPTLKIRTADSQQLIRKFTNAKNILLRTNAWEKDDTDNDQAEYKENLTVYNKNIALFVRKIHKIERWINLKTFIMLSPTISSTLSPTLVDEDSGLQTFFSPKTVGGISHAQASAIMQMIQRLLSLL